MFCYVYLLPKIKFLLFLFLCSTCCWVVCNFLICWHHHVLACRHNSTRAKGWDVVETCTSCFFERIIEIPSQVCYLSGCVHTADEFDASRAKGSWPFRQYMTRDQCFMSGGHCPVVPPNFSLYVTSASCQGTLPRCAHKFLSVGKFSSKKHRPDWNLHPRIEETWGLITKTS